MVRPADLTVPWSPVAAEARAGGWESCTLPPGGPPLVAVATASDRWQDRLGLPRRYVKVAVPGLPEGLPRPHVLGGGRKGEVKLLQQRDSGALVALKKVPQSTLKKVLHEYSLGSRVRSPHVLRPLAWGFDEVSRKAYLLFPYLPGSRSLEDVRLSALQLRQVLLDMLRALRACHAVGVVHGDVGAGNILVEPNGQARLIDFGDAVDLHDGRRGRSDDLCRFEDLRRLLFTVLDHAHGRPELQELHGTLQALYDEVVVRAGVAACRSQTVDAVLAHPRLAMRPDA